MSLISRLQHQTENEKHCDYARNEELLGHGRSLNEDDGKVENKKRLTQFEERKHPTLHYGTEQRTSNAVVNMVESSKANVTSRI